MDTVRAVFNMDKDWRFHLGEVASGRGNSHSASYCAAKAGGMMGAAAPSFDDSDWRTLDVPHDFFSESDFSPENLLSHGYRTRNNGWYRKIFTLDASLEGRQILLCFEGLSVTAEIFLNGSRVARSFSAYSELTVDITDRAYFGACPNVLAVYIGGFDTEGWWYEGAGIYRHVNLYAKNPLHIAHNGLWVKPVLKTDSENDWTVELETTVENTGYDSAGYSVEAYLYKGNQMIGNAASEQLLCGADGLAQSMISIDVENPDRWDVDSPKLYTLKAVLYQNGMQVDEDETTFGFRTTHIDPELGFLLNDRPVKLLGTCNHQDHAGVGVAVPDSIQHYRIKRLKEMGSNAYRCAHNPPAKAILDACDRYGMLVMDENRRFEASAETIGHVETLVKRDRNHPSVVIYSLFNEEPLQGSPEGRSIFKRLKSRVKKLDDTRLILGATNGGRNEEGTAFEMDATGFNYGLRYIESFHKNYPNQPIIGAENNSAVSTRGCYISDREHAHILNNYDDEKVPWGQVIKETWDFYRNHPYMSGIFVWTGFDYRGEPTPFTWPSVSSQFGILDTCGFAKDSFYFHKACFTSEPMLHLLPHWNWSEGETVRVMTVTNCEEVELFLNGVSLGRKKSDVCAQCDWFVDFIPGTISAKTYNDGKEVASAEIKTTGKPVKVKMNPDRTYINNDGADTLPLNVCVVDENGLTVPTADNHIVFTVEGDGKIIGVGNGDPNSHELDNIPERNLFAGWCQALLQSNVNAKSIRVTASCDGLASDTLELEVNKVTVPNYLYSSTNRQITGWTISAETFADRPDVLMELSDNDMNSFEPIIFYEKFQEGFRDGYKIYRTKVKIPKAGHGTENAGSNQSAAAPLQKFHFALQINSLKCEAIEVYFDGELISKQVTMKGEPLDADFMAEGGKVSELRVLVKAVPGEDSGIRFGVLMKTRG